jgi:hypothetical protein
MPFSYLPITTPAWNSCLVNLSDPIWRRPIFKEPSVWVWEAEGPDWEGCLDAPCEVPYGATRSGEFGPSIYLGIR